MFFPSKVFSTSTVARKKTTAVATLRSVATEPVELRPQPTLDTRALDQGAPIPTAAGALRPDPLLFTPPPYTHQQQGDAEAGWSWLHQQRGPGRQRGKDAPDVTLTLHEEGPGPGCTAKGKGDIMNGRFEWESERLAVQMPFPVYRPAVRAPVPRSSNDGNAGGGGGGGA